MKEQNVPLGDTVWSRAVELPAKTSMPVMVSPASGSTESVRRWPPQASRRQSGSGHLRIRILREAVESATGSPGQDEHAGPG
jgi:hypothetical protein